MSTPEYGLGFQVQVLETIRGIPSSLGSGAQKEVPGLAKPSIMIMRRPLPPPLPKKTAKFKEEVRKVGRAVQNFTSQTASMKSFLPPEIVRRVHPGNNGKMNFGSNFRVQETMKLLHYVE